MKVSESKIIVCCPHAVTGGPELLHQLVHELRNLGRDAYIAYYPFEQTFDCPEPYKKYNAPQSVLIDSSDTFILVPESATWLLRHSKQARMGIWWLSVDNYFPVLRQSTLRDAYYRIRARLRGRMPLGKMHGNVHFTQSRYAEAFLEKEGISSTPLTDYLGSEHLCRPLSETTATSRENVVAFNPKKGQKQTRALMNAYPNIKFVPIQNMTPKEVAELLGKAKIYIDFGHHPGKDRPPREAAMAGCCVITGRKGSARYIKDVLIPDKYKLDDSNKHYVKTFGLLADHIFERFSDHAKDFDAYRVKILNEPDVFKQQIRQIFG